MPDRRRRRRRRADHPAWKFAQVAVASAALMFFAVHLGDGGHAASLARGDYVDPADGSVALGVGLALKLAYQLLVKLGGPS